MVSSAFDTSQVKDKRDAVNGRFSKIKSMAAGRRAKLNESHRLHQFFRDLDDEESWIKYVFFGLFGYKNNKDKTPNICFPLGKRNCW